uniref:RAB7A interacting MON1-CCZ1 complex subunit 1 n=1 Tax=Salvator merianae TaxID=96440 RepID=A0A8D0E0Y8_SALMN
MAGTEFVAKLQQPLARLERRLHRLSQGGEFADAFLTQASATLDNLIAFSREPSEDHSLSKLLQLYTQALLDTTFFEENQLVDKDFPEESSLKKVEELIGVLSEPEILIRQISTTQEPASVLGIELLECLYWRRGALLYMFCHTVKGRKEGLMQKTDSFQKLLNEGIQYLVKMLEFRCPDNPNEEFSFQDANAARLVQEGIFSDTHLLAMMYGGEMCYWGLKYYGRESEHKQNTDIEPLHGAHNQVLDFRETGEKMLQKYIAACEGPLRAHEWDTKNAKHILDYFKHFKT